MSKSESSPALNGGDSRCRLTMSELHKHIAGHEYPCGIVSAVCFYEGSAKAALYARQMGLPFLAALYSVRNAYR